MTPPTTAPFWRCGRCGTPNPSASYVTRCVACGTPRAFAVPIDPVEARSSSPATPARGRARSRWPLIVAASYGVFVLIVLALFRGVGDDSALVAAALLMPRLVFLVPVVAMAIWAGLRRRPIVGLIVGFDALIVLGPLMGFNLPMARLGARADGPTIRIMTFNRGDRAVDLARLDDYLRRQEIDVVCVEEFRPDPDFDAVFLGRGWHANETRSIFSRFPIVESIARTPDLNDTEFRYTAILYRARLVGPDGREFVVGMLHMPTLRPGIARLFRGDLAGFRLHDAWWKAEFARMLDALGETGRTPLLLGGDFNNVPEANLIASAPRDYHLHSAFDLAGLGFGYTRPARLAWARIDHLWATEDWTVLNCWVGPSFGSDHRSMVAEVALTAAPPVTPR